MVWAVLSNKAPFTKDINANFVPFSTLVVDSRKFINPNRRFVP